MQILPSIDRIRELLDYCPSTGSLTWKEYRNPQAIKGQEAGHISAEGYRVIGFDNKVYQSHRLAWAHYYGSWPHGQLDHTNHNREDNRILNLREVTHTQNQRNRSKTGRIPLVLQESIIPVQAGGLHESVSTESN